MAHGKLLVAQAGGATAAINNSLAGVVEQAREHFDDVWGVRRGGEGLAAEDLVDLGSVPSGVLERVAATPGAALASSRLRLNDEQVHEALNFFRRGDIVAFLYIGGNDSADTVHRLALAAADRHQDLAAIAVPKTIDNDLPITDHSPGYGSIARYIAVATMDSAKDTESMPGMYPVKFIEVMGRDAGWVAAASSLGRRERQDGPHLIYLPERPVTPERLLRDVSRIYQEFGRVVAVVTETVRDDDGRPFADPGQVAETDAFGHPLIRGTADLMCRLVQEHLGLRARWDKPGSLQRMSMECASAIDLAEARETGRAAVRLAMHAVTDRMVTLVRDSDEPYHSHTNSSPLADIANHQRLLPDEFLAESGTDVTTEFSRYAMPLLGGPLPTYVRLMARKV